MYYYICTSETCEQNVHACQEIKLINGWNWCILLRWYIVCFAHISALLRTLTDCSAVYWVLYFQSRLSSTVIRNIDYFQIIVYFVNRSRYWFSINAWFIEIVLLEFYLWLALTALVYSILCAVPCWACSLFVAPYIGFGIFNRVYHQF